MPLRVSHDWAPIHFSRTEPSESKKKTISATLSRISEITCHENASFPFLRQNTHLATALVCRPCMGGQFPVARRAWWRHDCRTASSRSAWLRPSAVDQSTAISTNARWMDQSAWRHRRQVDFLLEKDATADFFSHRLFHIMIEQRLNSSLP